MAPRFLPPLLAPASGLVGITRRLTPDALLAAYARGIFPWSEDPVRWYSPDPRAILLPHTAHLPRNLGKLARRARLRASYDRAFTAVMRHCAAAHAEDGVWIGPQFIAAYSALHARGFAHSVEVWQDDALVGGLYGVQLGGMFAGESMFYRVANASKLAFAALLTQLAAQGVVLLDAQVRNPHSARLGAVDVPRAEFLRLLAAALRRRCPGSGAPWTDVPAVR